MEEDPKQRELGIAILQFMQILDAIYGVYLDSGAAFHQFRSFLIQSQKQTHAITGLSMEEIDERLFSYGEGHASTGDRVLHQATQKEVKKAQ